MCYINIYDQLYIAFSSYIMNIIIHDLMIRTSHTGNHHRKDIGLF